MGTVKIAIPLGGKDSKAFRDALKVTIAATAYNANVKWAKGTKVESYPFLTLSYRWEAHSGAYKGQVDLK